MSSGNESVLRAARSRLSHLDKIAYEAQKNTYLDGPSIGVTWTCPQCNSTNATHVARCQCGAPRSTGGTTNVVQNRALNKGEKPKGYNPLPQFGPTSTGPARPKPIGPTPPGHAKRMSVAQQVASVQEAPKNPKSMLTPLSLEHLQGEVDDPISKLKEMIDRHDKKKKSFDALFGGPESDYPTAVP